MKRIKKSLPAFTIILTLFFLAGILFYIHRTATNPLIHTDIPESYLASVDYSIYAPAPAPQGFTLDTTTISSTDQVFVYRYSYTASDTANQEFIISVQPLPKNFDVTKFKPTQEFQIDIGRAYAVDLETRTTAAVVTSDALIFINAPQPTGINLLQSFLNSFKRAQ